MAPQRLPIMDLNSADRLAALYARCTIPEIAERLECSIGTVRNRMSEFGIQTRNGATSSLQTRIEKAAMVIQNQLSTFDRPTRALILGPVVKGIKDLLADDPTCPICRQALGHLSWCSMAQPHNAIMED